MTGHLTGSSSLIISSIFGLAAGSRCKHLRTRARSRLFVTLRFADHVFEDLVVSGCTFHREERRNCTHRPKGNDDKAIYNPSNMIGLNTSRHSLT